MKQAEPSFRVLVVDDEEDIVAPLADILDDFGYEVDVAHSGREAVERVRDQAPDAILMDIRMPDLDGVAAFREIKRLSPRSVVIFMTAYSSSQLVDQARHEGALEVLPKPLDVERVVELIERAARQTPVLVVDDDDDFNAALSDALESQNFDVRRATTFDEAVENFEREPRRVVLLDLKLDDDGDPGDGDGSGGGASGGGGSGGGRNGLDALLIFKKLDPRAAVILMTGFEDMRDALRRGLEMSAHAALFKPFDVEELIALIRRAAAAR